MQKNAVSSWLATYRLLSKATPCIPEVAIRMAQLSEFERSYSHVLLYPPQPAAMLDIAGRSQNFTAKMYGYYLEEQRRQLAAGTPVSESFLVWHRTRQYDPIEKQLTYRGGGNQRSEQTMVVACRYQSPLLRSRARHRRCITIHRRIRERMDGASDCQKWHMR